jgi:hypothetical protein
MKKKRKNRPMGLEDIVIGSGLNASDSYGWDHTPRFEEGNEDALYREATRELRACFQEYGGLALLTLLGAINKTNGNSDPPNLINIAGVELAQALMLQETGTGKSPTPEQARSFTNALVTHLHLFMGQTSKPRSDAKAKVLSRRMAQTLLVRHTYYAHHADKVFLTIGDELEMFGREVLGMSLKDASKIALAAAHLVSYLTNASPAPANILAWLDGRNAPFDLEWLSLFEVPVHVLSAALPQVGAVAIETVLDHLSITPGALAAANSDHLHLDNPIWRRPFVKAGGRWFCFSPGTLLAAHADVMSALAEKVSSKPGELLGKARANALEAMAAQALSEMFPHGEVLSSVFWTDPYDGDEHETDLIVLIDQHVMIFEAKSHVLSTGARRGSAAWFKLFDDVVVKASVQASRLEAILRDRGNPVLEVRTDQGIRTISKDEVRHVVRFGISLERLTTASYGTEDELRARIERSGAKPMPIFTIGDLWLIRDLVGSEGRCVHFLLRRAELELDHEFIADELDLIALYLKTGFVRLWRKGFDPGPLAIYGLSDLLRYHVKGTAHFDPRYRLPKRTTPWWDRIITDREQKRPRGWIDMIYDLLNVPLVSQEKFWSDIVALRRRIRRNSSERSCTAVLMQVPEQQHPSAFACLVTGKMPDMARVHAARTVLNEVNKTHPDERLFVFCLNASGDAAPVLPYYWGVDWSREVHAFVEAGESLDSGLFIAVDPDL